MPKQGGKFVLSSAEEAQLQQLIRAQNTPQGLAQRVRVVQLASQGMGVRAIGGRVGMHYNQVAKWRRRYLRGGDWGAAGRAPLGPQRQYQHGTVAPDRRSSHPATAGPGTMDLPRDGSPVWCLQGDRATSLESKRDQATPNACL